MPSAGKTNAVKRSSRWAQKHGSRVKKKGARRESREGKTSLLNSKPLNQGNRKKREEKIGSVLQLNSNVESSRLEPSRGGKKFAKSPPTGGTEVNGKTLLGRFVGTWPSPLEKKKQPIHLLG